MSFVNPTPGDIQYSQYAVIDTLPIAAGVSTVKGNCYTNNDDGFLVALTAASGAVDNKAGIFQAMADSVAVSGEADGDRRVQCLMKRSRIILKAPVGAHTGDDAAIEADGSTVEADKIQVSSTQKIGTVFEILTLDGRQRKPITADDDLVLVDLIE